jgi:hypothetical protein
MSGYRLASREIKAQLGGLLDEGQVLWLDKQLEAADGKRTILMSHHFIILNSGLPRESGTARADHAARHAFAVRVGTTRVAEEPTVPAPRRPNH